MLLHRATGMLASPACTGGNGDPVAMSARPPVQSARSCGRASLRLPLHVRSHAPDDLFGEGVGGSGQAGERGGCAASINSERLAALGAGHGGRPAGG